MPPFSLFQPISATFALFGVPHSPEPPRCSRSCRSAPDAFRHSGTEAHNPTRQANRERNERKAATSPQAHKKGYPPPPAGKKTLLPSTIFRAKKSAKSHLGRFEKIFGKIFRGNVSGERKTPRVVSTEGGCLTNENREISNLAMQKTKNAQKL